MPAPRNPLYTARDKVDSWIGGPWHRKAWGPVRAKIDAARRAAGKEWAEESKRTGRKSNAAAYVKARKDAGNACYNKCAAEINGEMASMRQQLKAADTVAKVAALSKGWGGPAIVIPKEPWFARDIHVTFELKWGQYGVTDTASRISMAKGGMARLELLPSGYGGGTLKVRPSTAPSPPRINGMIVPLTKGKGFASAELSDATFRAILEGVKPKPKPAATTAAPVVPAAVAVALALSWKRKGGGWYDLENAKARFDLGVSVHQVSVCTKRGAEKIVLFAGKGLDSWTDPLPAMKDMGVVLLPSKRAPGKYGRYVHALEAKLTAAQAAKIVGQ